MKQLTPQDSIFYFLDAPNQPMMIGSLWICDQSTAPNGIVRHKQILQYIDDRLCTTSVFRRRLQHAPLYLDEPYWLEDKNFDVEYHVRHVGLPHPGDWRQLQIFAARTLSRAVDMTRAPWEIIIIEGLNNVEGVAPGSFAVLIRFHHAYVDGKSSQALSLALMEDTADHLYGARCEPQLYEQPPTPAEMWMRTAPRLVEHSLRSMRAGFDLAVKGTELVTRMQRDKVFDQTSTPKTIFNTEISPHRTFGSHRWNLSELKAIRTLCEGASLNDVMLSIVAGGMRRYLLTHNALPEKKSLVSLCPVALRPGDTKYDGGNLISGMFIPIGTDIEDPVERLATVRRRTAAQIPLAKEVFYPLNHAAGNLYPTYMRAMFAWIQNRAKLAAQVPVINTVITNVPGVPDGNIKYFAGAKIQSVHPFVPISDGMAIGHAVTSFYDDMTLGVVADRNVVPDIDYYMECLEASVREYTKLVAGNKPGKKAKTGSAGKRVPKAKASAAKKTKQAKSAKAVAAANAS